MTCIIAHATRTSSFIAADKLGSNNFTKAIQSEPKIFEKEFDSRVLEEGFIPTIHKDTMTIGYTTSFRMGQLLKHCLVLPEKQPTQSFKEYLVQSVVPAIRTLFREEWGSRADNQDVGGGQFIILHKHKIYEIHEDFCVLEPKNNISAVGSGAYHAIAAMAAYLTVETETEVPLVDRIGSIFDIVSDHVVSVSFEHDILKY